MQRLAAARAAALDRDRSMSTSCFLQRVAGRIALVGIACACALGIDVPAIADEHPNWDLQIGAGIAYMPDYSGARASSPRLRTWADGSYRTPDLGTFAIDSGSLTIDPAFRWDFVDKRDLGLGVLLGYRSGRSDSSPRFASANSGSARLAGLPSIRGSIDAGVEGHVAIFSVPLFAQVRSATSGSQGMRLNVGAYLPQSLGSAFELALLPTVTWVDSREMRAFYGVSAQHAAKTGFAAYNPRGAWENAALEVVGDWQIGIGWHFIASAAYQRLLGNAAASPLVQTRSQASAVASVAWSF